MGGHISMEEVWFVGEGPHNDGRTVVIECESARCSTVLPIMAISLIILQILSL